MKKEDVPQDLSSLGKITKEVCYATDSSGKYSTELSRGWDIKIAALDTAWQDIRDRVEAAREKVLKGQASPLLFFMERGLMDIGIVSAYTGFWKMADQAAFETGLLFQAIGKKLQRYAEIFTISVEDLKSMNLHED